MNKTLFYLILLLCGTLLSKAADTRIEAHIFITNAPSGWPTQSLTWNGSSTRTWTNIVAAPALQIMATNNIQNSRTNLKVQLDTYKFSLLHQVSYGTNTNEVVVLSGTNQPIAITIAGLWAYVSYITNTVAGQDFVMMPFTPQQNTNGFGVKIMSLLATNFAKATSAIPATAIGMTNFLNLSPQAQSATNKSTFGGTNAPQRLVATNGVLSLISLINVIATNLTGSITNPFVRGGTNELGVFTNVLRMNVDLGVVTNLYALNAVVSNGVLIGVIELNGTFTKLTNGTLYHASVTNAPWVWATNLVGFGGYLSNMTAYSLTVTNLQAPGGGNNSTLLGLGALASGDQSIGIGYLASADGADAIAIGNEPSVTGDYGIAIGGVTTASALGVALGYSATASTADQFNPSIAIGYGSFASAPNSAAFGTSVSTSTTNEFKFGNDATIFSVPGRISAGSLTNSLFRGTNVVNGRVDFTSRSVSSLVNGANSGIVLGTNVYVKLSGGTTISALSGFQAAQDGTFHILQISGGVTNVIVNEANSTDFSTDAAAANRIVTGTGTNFYSTNNPLVLPIIYDSAASRWRVISFLR